MASIANPAAARSGAGGLPSASGGVITPRCTRASCQIPSAWLATTSSTGVATSLACTSRSAATSSGVGSGSSDPGGPPGPCGTPAPGPAPAPSSPSPPSPCGGRCSPDGVHKLLTLVSFHVDNRWEVGLHVTRVGPHRPVACHTNVVSPPETVVAKTPE